MFFGALAVVAAPASAQTAVPVDQVHVVDGDTLRIGDQRIRLHGVDAPEIDQTCEAVKQCGVAAQQALRLIIELSRAIECEATGQDRYRRTIATCFTADGVNINREMVARGWAVAYRKYSTRYVADEDAAHRQRLGIWRGQFVMPWDWRSRKR